MDKRSPIALISMGVTATGLLLLLLLPLAADASVSFTFQDPSAAMEFQYVEGDALNPGHISYNSPTGSKAVQLTIDASDHGLAPVVFNAMLEIDLGVSTETNLGFGAIANVTGAFRFFEIGIGAPALIFEGLVTNGSLFVIGTTGAQVASSTDNTLILNAGPVLQNYLDQSGLSLAKQMDSSFSLSGITLASGGAGAPGSNPFGYMNSFASDAAYVGNADIVPSPPAALGLMALTVTTRRRKRPAA